jgi:two-component system OmpR family response regulator
MSHTILVIEDDRDIAELVALHLRDEGFEVDLVHDGRDGLAMAEQGHYDLLVLDLMLPGMDGLSICRQLRAGPDFLPILMLTAKSSELDRVLGLEMGADDYLTKPFSIRELVARVKAQLRRSEARLHDRHRFRRRHRQPSTRVTCASMLSGARSPSAARRLN